MAVKALIGMKHMITGLFGAAFVVILYSYYDTTRSNNTVSNIPRTMMLGDNYRVAAINPRDVFLLYTKTYKTSSTVVSSLIMEAYLRYGIPVANNAKSIEAGFIGTYASVNHFAFESDTVENIVKLTGKPVILVVSIRDGYDWLKSWIARANRETNMVANGSFVQRPDMCDRFSPPEATAAIRSALPRYMKYLPVEAIESEHGDATNNNTKAVVNKYKLTYTPWSVIRHEHVIDDTCDLLKRLGMECNRDAAFGQASRKQVGLGNCKYKPDAGVVDNVNKINEILWRARAEHEGIIRV